MIVERIKHLVDSGIDPSKILAITFTNKAAKVMQERLVTMNVKGITASTMHSLAVRLMMKAGEEFSIYDEDDCFSIIKRIAKHKKITDKNELYDISNEIALLKDNQITLTSCASKYRDIFLEYEHELYQNNARDFADLINNLVTRSRNNLSWCHILVDEAQDLSFAQLQVVKNLYLKQNDKDTLCIVFDLDQSCYEWRHAKPTLLKEFIEKSSGDVIPLAINFRSTRSVVHYSKKLITHNKNRIDKPLTAYTDEFGIIPRVQSFYDSVEEAEYVANLCSKSTDVCVLYRSNWMSAQLELALKNVHVNYTVSDSIQFLDRKEIKDVLSYIRVAVNSKDMVSLRRSISSPKRGIGKKALEGVEKFEDIIDNEKMQEYVSLIYNLREGKEDAGTAIHRLLSKTRYFGIEEADRVRNLEQLTTMLKSRTLEEAMFDLTGGVPTEGDNSRINLMTLHSCKGSEYKKVIIIGCEEGITPHINSENLEEERRLFYVGMTRTEKELIFTYTRKRLMFGCFNYMQPSRFFQEIGLKI